MNFNLNKVPNWLIGLTLFLFALLSFCLFNWDRELIRLECRFMVFLRELADNNGLSAVFPTLYGQPYADYPATYVLVSYWFSKLFGSLSTFALTLPVALAMAYAVVVTFLIGAEQSKRLGLVAALLLLCTYGFINGGRAISMDAFVCLGSVCAFRFADRSRRRSSIVYFLFGLLAIGFAFLFRGPLGAVVASAAFLAAYANIWEWKRGFLAAIPCGLVFLGLTLGLLAVARNAYDSEILSKVIDAQVGGRLSGAGKPVWLYFTNGLAEFACVFPLALLSLWFARRFVWRSGRSPEEELYGRFLLAGLLIVVGLTIPSTRHLRYIIPAMPFFALAAASLWASPSLFALPERVKKAIDWLSPGRLALAAVLLSAAWIFLIGPLEVRSQNSRDFVKAVEKAMPSRLYAFLEVDPDGDELKFLCNSSTYFNPVFFKRDIDLHNVSLPIIARDKVFKTLEVKTKVKVEGEMGHKGFVAFLPEK